MNAGTLRFVPSPTMATSGLSIIMTHGLMGSKRNWYSVAQALSDPVAHGNPNATMAHHVMAIDWRNHGTGPRGTEHTLETMTNDLELFINTYFPKDNLVLVGHSMGASAILNSLWKNHSGFRTLPQNIVGAVAVDMAPAPRPQFFHRMMKHIGFLKTMPTNQMSSHKEAMQWVLANGPPDLVSNKWLIMFFLTNLVRRSGAMTWIGDMEAIHSGMQRSEWPHLPPTGDTADDMRSSIPVQFIFGANSPYYNQVAVQSIDKFFLNARIDVVEGAGHFVHFDNKSKFLDVLVQFLETVAIRKFPDVPGFE